DSGVERMYDTDVYVELAQRAERAKLDFLFRPDTLFLATHAVATEPGFSSLDPMVLLATLARETTHIGLVSTASTTFNPPYVVARQLQSLNWVTQGRAGWNIVTAIDGQQNFGQQTMLPSEARYQKAREFTDVVLQLWNSYPSSAIKADKQ
ncbi:LLM class flavin-dependent oxidoreductase, partial [Vibrio parahaemolyticus]